VNSAAASHEDQHLLLRRAIEGSESAFAAIYRAHAKAIYGLALRITGQHACAEDVVQDAFLRALQQGAGFRGQASLGHWLKRIAANAAVDRIRRDRKWRNLEDADILVAPDQRDAQLDEVLGLLSVLSAPARSVVWLHEMEGYSHLEISRLFGQSESWSKSVLARSLKKLKSLIEETA
jgi:RNA polymerase sigma-70 factor (ECF subfamily)